MLKLALISAPVALGAAVADDVITTPTTQIAALAAGAAGAIYLWRNVLRPFAKLIRRALTAYEHLEQLPPFVAQTRQRLDTLEATASSNEDSLEAITRHLQIPRRDRDRRRTSAA